MDALELGSNSHVDVNSGTSRRISHDAGVYIFLISFASLYYLLNTPVLLVHYDLGWHLAAGDLIRERGSIPFQDPWSFTLGNKQWYNLSWLWDVIASITVQYTGLAGLVALTVACGAVIVGTLASICLRSGASATAVCISVFVACLLYPAFAAAPNIYLSASPNTATMLFCVIFYAECLKRTRLWSLPLMMVLWVNLHGGFMLGFLIVGVFVCAAVFKHEWRAAKILGFAGAGCAVAVFVNPYGWHIYDGVTATLGHFVQAYITEWQSYYENITIPDSLPGMAWMLAFIALELRFRGSHPVPLETRLLSWLLLFLGLYQFRYLSFFFLFSTVPMALHLDRLLSERRSSSDIGRALLAVGIAGACALPLAFVQMKPSSELPQMLSQQDARYLEDHFTHARLLNHWNVGGNLIYGTRGTVPVFVDGRAATAYPDDLLRDYFKLVKEEVDENAWDAVLAKYRIDAVLWVKAHEQLRRFLVDKRGWKEAYAGQYETVYVKP